MSGASIVGIGHYLPELIVTTEEIAERLDIHAGRLVKAAGIKERRVVTEETSSYMGAEALREALADAHIQLEQIDCIIGATQVVCHNKRFHVQQVLFKKNWTQVIQEFLALISIPHV